MVPHIFNTCWNQCKSLPSRIASSALEYTRGAANAVVSTTPKIAEYVQGKLPECVTRPLVVWGSDRNPLGPPSSEMSETRIFTEIKEELLRELPPLREEEEREVPPTNSIQETNAQFCRMIKSTTNYATLVMLGSAATNSLTSDLLAPWRAVCSKIKNLYSYITGRTFTPAPQNAQTPLFTDELYREMLQHTLTSPATSCWQTLKIYRFPQLSLYQKAKAAIVYLLFANIIQQVIESSASHLLYAIRKQSHRPPSSEPSQELTGIVLKWFDSFLARYNEAFTLYSQDPLQSQARWNDYKDQAICKLLGKTIQEAALEWAQLSLSTFPCTLNFFQKGQSNSWRIIRVTSSLASRLISTPCTYIARYVLKAKIIPNLINNVVTQGISLSYKTSIAQQFIQQLDQALADFDPNRPATQGNPRCFHITYTREIADIVDKLLLALTHETATHAPDRTTVENNATNHEFIPGTEAFRQRKTKEQFIQGISLVLNYFTDPDHIEEILQNTFTAIYRNYEPIPTNAIEQFITATTQLKLKAKSLVTLIAARQINSLLAIPQEMIQQEVGSHLQWIQAQGALALAQCTQTLQELEQIPFPYPVDTPLALREKLSHIRRALYNWVLSIENHPISADAVDRAALQGLVRSLRELSQELHQFVAMLSILQEEETLWNQKSASLRTLRGCLDLLADQPIPSITEFENQIRPFYPEDPALEALWTQAQISLRRHTVVNAHLQSLIAIRPHLREFAQHISSRGRLQRAIQQLPIVEDRQQLHGLTNRIQTREQVAQFERSLEISISTYQQEQQQLTHTIATDILPITAWLQQKIETLAAEQALTQPQIQIHLQEASAHIVRLQGSLTALRPEPQQRLGGDFLRAALTVGLSTTAYLAVGAWPLAAAAVAGLAGWHARPLATRVIEGSILDVFDQAYTFTTNDKMPEFLSSLFLAITSDFMKQRPLPTPRSLSPL